MFSNSHTSIDVISCLASRDYTFLERVLVFVLVSIIFKLKRLNVKIDGNSQNIWDVFEDLYVFDAFCTFLKVFVFFPRFLNRTFNQNN